MDYDALTENGMEGLGADAAATPAVPWWQSLIQNAGQVYAARQIAKTGQVPQAQLNVGMTADTKKMLIYGGALAIGGFMLYQFFGKRGRR